MSFTPKVCRYCEQHFSTATDMGRHYGYPGCCIDDYLHRLLRYDAGLPSDLSPRKLDGSGFVPCPVHDQYSQEALIGLIGDLRECSLAFDPDPAPKPAEVAPW